MPSADLIAGLASVLLRANARWYLERWELGRNPRTTAAGLLYAPLPASKAPAFSGAPVVLRRGKADCAEAAALEGGADLARAIDQGFTWGDAAPLYAVRVSPGLDPGRSTRLYWHVTLATPEGERDPTRTMRKASR